MDNVARRKEGAKQHAFLVYGVRFGTASEKNEIKIENVEIDLKTTKPDAKGVMAIFGARSRKTANDNKISIINTNFTGDTKRVGLIVGATVDAYISSFSERDVTKQPPPEGANRNVIKIRGSTIPGGGLIAAWYYDHDKAKVDTTKLRFEEIGSKSTTRSSGLRTSSSSATECRFSTTGWPRTTIWSSGRT